ncbi:Kinesin-1 [Ananas comosus]|uniref:Kinesin-like protein n=1 Tax=Ananas comosus TaxID=4615 RepID=A0A199UFJ9_ANACO|nr:Kinesin-1 [Ananas comosus]
MSLRSRTNPPRSPLNKKENLDEGRADKRRKVAVGKMVGATSNLRSRPVLSVVNAGATAGAGDPAAADGANGGVGIEFSSREDVERLLNEKMKGKNKNDFKGKSEQMMEYIKKLRACIKWLTEQEDGNLMEMEKLRNLLDSEEKNHAEIAAQLRNTNEELNSTIEELRKQLATLEEKYRKEEAEKMGAIRSCEEEKEARLAAESRCNALSAELDKAGHEAKRLNDQIKMLQETNKRLQEYNTSLQQYNSNLQADAQKNGEAISKLQKEKNAMMETLNGLRDHVNSVKNQLDISRASQQEASKQKEELKKELNCFRNELQQVRDDRDHQLNQVQCLMAEIVKYKELTGKSALELDNATSKTNALEEACSSQRDIIKTLKLQLAAANEKLKMADLTAMETMSENEEKKKMLKDLQDRLADAEQQISEGEKLRKKLHNTILELKGNIRVFCRVRPLLPDAQKYSFTFDKVFDQDASQEDVFVEISQLVQSALDGYKASMLEIYNETIRDLLNPNRSGSQDTGASKYLIKHDANGNTHVSDLTVVDVCSINEVSFLLRQAAQSRSVGKTQMNEQSSRSHFVFTLRISGVNESTDQQVQGVLNLIDLAGSERLAKSGSTGDRLKETQPCLGGDSKTLMFVNISPEASSTGESICSLRFAARVNACEIGVPRRQTQMRTLDSRLSYERKHGVAHLLNIVEQSVGKVCKRLLLLIRSCGDDLIEIVVHDS